MERQFDERVDQLKIIRAEIDTLELEAKELSIELVTEYGSGAKVEGKIARGTVASKETINIDAKRLHRELVKRLGNRNGLIALLSSVSVVGSKAKAQLPMQSYDRLAKVVKVSEYVTTRFK